MALLWIVHRDPGRRLALARLAAEPSAVIGGPSDRLFDGAGSASVVLLGIGGDFEAELEFAHRHAPRLRGTAWILVPEPSDLGEVRRLFDTLPAELLAFPPEARTLRGLLAAARQRRRADPLSERRTRDGLAARFARWFADLEFPDLLRALDPQLARVPLLVRGEPGTGRGLLARYVHAFGGTTGGAFLSIDCPSIASTPELASEIARGAGRSRARSSLTVCLEEVHRLPPQLFHELRSWIEIAPPEEIQQTTWLRWIGTAAEPFTTPPETESALLDSLGGITVRIPPVRDRPKLVPALVQETTLAWAEAHGARPRRFSEGAIQALREYPWPGNLRELEAVVLRTLAGDASDPIPASSVRFDRDAVPAGWTVEEKGPGEELARPGTPAPTGSPAAEEAQAPAGPSPGPALDRAFTRRFLGALAHELRNPLVPIRTLADLLPERFSDAEFRSRFADRVGADVGRIEATLDRLAEFAALPPPENGPVDLAGLLDRLLEEHREEIQRRRLLVLKELDRGQPLARGDAAHLELALRALLDKTLELVPEGGDLYLASKHHASGLRGKPSVRVLIRYHSPTQIARKGGIEGTSLAESALEIVLADALVHGMGGQLTLDASGAEETVVVLDLPG
ncbi:MAG TPA: histidine kinase dimerization/phospho-acceptor domain-containing protein [Myxococcota bacterium]|nr:histidine kinase dimerization/phospho-acceptor domain-containing protein [Myxococcota bacterium]